MSSLPRKRQYQLEEVIKGCPVIRGDDALVQAFLEAVAATNGR
jgi:hypothetical protein